MPASRTGTYSPALRFAPPAGRPVVRPSDAGADALLALGVSRPVYDCRWPEIRALVATFGAELASGALAHLSDRPYDGLQEGIAAQYLGAWRDYASPVVRFPTWAEGAQGLAKGYPTAGSTEAIRESLAVHAIRRGRNGKMAAIHVFDGEYEGYAAEYRAYGGIVHSHSRDNYRTTLLILAAEGDAFYLSAPSAIDGNVWAGYDDFLRFVESELPKLAVRVDLTYVGTVARAFVVDTTSPVIDTLFFSLSKVFGVYYHRIGGAFARDGLPGLTGNQKWFQNTLSLALGTMCCETRSVFELPRRYQPMQAARCDDLGVALGTPVVPSDVVLLATAALDPDAPQALLQGLARGARGAERARLCLTPGFDRLFAAVLPSSPVSDA